MAVFLGVVPLALDTLGWGNLIEGCHAEVERLYELPTKFTTAASE